MSARIPARARARNPLLAVAGADRVDAARLRRRARRCSRAPLASHATAGGGPWPERPRGSPRPRLSLIVAAHDEQAVIAAKVQNALELDYPRERLEVIVACDGCATRPRRARAQAGADLVLELPRGGKIRAQDAAVERARGRDRRVLGRQRAVGAGRGSGARRRLRRPAGRLRLRAGAASCRPPATPGAANQEGVYWRYELAVRALESRLCSITAGNGAIYATRRDSLHRRRPDHGPRPVASLQHGQARPARGVRAEAPAQREDGALARRGVRAQAADDEPHVADRAARRDALAARLPARLRADDLLPPPAALLHAGPARARAGANVALLALGAGPLYVVTLALQLALLLAAALAGARARCARC